jgi:hypothetical protein
MGPPKLQQAAAKLRASYEVVTKGVQCPRTGCKGIISRIDAFGGVNLRWTKNENGKWLLQVSEPLRWTLACSGDKQHETKFTNKNVPKEFKDFCFLGSDEYKPMLDRLKRKLN